MKQITEEAKEKKRVYMKAWHAAHPECRKAQNAAYRAKNRERLSKARADWRAANRDEHLANCAAWYAENREKQLADKRAEYRLAKASSDESFLERLRIATELRIFGKKKPGALNSQPSVRPATRLGEIHLLAAFA